MKLRPISKKWIFWGINGLLALLSVACAFACLRISTALPTLGAADSWAGNSTGSFAQLACFLPVDGTLQEEAIWTFRQKLNEKLTEAAMEAPENGSLFSDAYSGRGSVSVSGPRGTAEVKVTGVGGDFFRFHPFQLRSGAYLSSSDLMQDRVLLDEELAWKLFGSTEITGMSLTIGKSDYYVAGVIVRESDRYSTAAYTDGAGMFMFYSALKACAEDTGIDCYEIVLPNPISSYGKNLLQESFPVNDGVLVENSSRYSVNHLLSVAKDYGRRSMSTRGIIYPYWENAVRMTEDHAALLLILTIILALSPTLSALITAILVARRTGRQLTGTVRRKVSDRIERTKEDAWRKSTEKRE